MGLSLRWPWYLLEEAPPLNVQAHLCLSQTSLLKSWQPFSHRLVVLFSQLSLQPHLLGRLSTLPDLAKLALLSDLAKLTLSLVLVKQILLSDLAKLILL